MNVASAMAASSGSAIASMPSRISSTPQTIPHFDACFINAAGVVAAIAIPFRRIGRTLAGAIIRRVAAHCGRPGPDTQAIRTTIQQFSNASLLFFHTIKALGVELKQMRSIILGLGGTAAAFLETHATGRRSLAIASRHGDELHQVQCNV